MSKTTETPAAETATTVPSETVTVKLMHDGQTITFPIPLAIASEDRLLLDFLTSSGMSGAANGLVKRHENGTIEVIKRAGANGAAGLTALAPPEAVAVEVPPEMLLAGLEAPEVVCPIPRLGVVGLMVEGLREAPPHFNPAVALAWVLSRAEQQGGIDLMALLLVQGAVQTAIRMGEADTKQIKGFIDRLEEARPLPWKGGSALI